MKDVSIDSELFTAYGHGWPWWSADGIESAERMTEPLIWLGKRMIKVRKK